MTIRVPVARIAVWAGSALAAIAVVVVASLPASWMAGVVERQSNGTVSMADAQGSLWHGSAVVAAATADDAAMPLLPGRFEWTLSPLIVFGQLALSIDNPMALEQTVQVRGDWREWQISPASVTLPAHMLVGIGAPLNTIQPTGDMQLSWGALQLKRTESGVEVHGPMTLSLHNMASQLSPIRPLGSYRMALDWSGNAAHVMLSTLQGPLMLDGAGRLQDGRLQFSGQARAAAGQEEKLANLINLLGQRQAGDPHSVAIEFK